MGINAAGLNLIKRYEGLGLTAYQCAAGVWTIGYGHTGKVDGKIVRRGMKITAAKAVELLEADVNKFWKYVCQTSYVPCAAELNDNQKAALCSFAFNCGQNNLKTLCRNRTPAEIADALLLYNKAGGKALSGLTERRKAERKLFLSGSGEVRTKDMDTLRNGDKGQQVRALQKLLGGLTVDGIFGHNTQNAVLTFQKKHQLDQDGIVGLKTWSMMLK